MTADSAAPVTAGAPTMAGKLLKRPGPIYPESAKQGHGTGTRILNATIGRDGHIRSLRVVKAPAASLAMSALNAVSRWIYAPYLLNRVAVDVETKVTVNYEMEQ